jgi:hypothetical protein
MEHNQNSHIKAFPPLFLLVSGVVEAVECVGDAEGHNLEWIYLPLLFFYSHRPAAQPGKVILHAIRSVLNVSQMDGESLFQRNPTRLGSHCLPGSPVMNSLDLLSFRSPIGGAAACQGGVARPLILL